MLWFLHELMLASVVLVIIRKFDKNDRLHKLGGKTNIFVLLLLSLVVWGSANILNTPLIEVYRNGIYIFMFLLGYYIFSHDHIQELLAKWTLPLLGIATVLCVLFCVTYWGQNYSAMPILKGFLTNMYAWFGTLAVFAFAKKYMDKETSFTRFMRGNSFGYYVLHYPLMISAACLIDHYFDIPAILFYVLIIVCEIVLLPIITEVIKRIPVIRTLLLGLRR